MNVYTCLGCLLGTGRSGYGKYSQSRRQRSERVAEEGNCDVAQQLGFCVAQFSLYSTSDLADDIYLWSGAFFFLSPSAQSFVD
jgi:hypothetical protein